MVGAAGDRSQGCLREGLPREAGLEQGLEGGGWPSGQKASQAEGIASVKKLGKCLECSRKRKEAG